MMKNNPLANLFWLHILVYCSLLYFHVGYCFCWCLVLSIINQLRTQTNSIYKKLSSHHLLVSLLYNSITKIMMVLQFSSVGFMGKQIACFCRSIFSCKPNNKKIYNKNTDYFACNYFERLKFQFLILLYFLALILS